MGDSGRFAVGIAIMIAAMIFFFIAFHPGGVEDASGVNIVQNPVDVIKWLMKEFNNADSSSTGSS